MKGYRHARPDTDHHLQVKLLDLHLPDDDWFVCHDCQKNLVKKIIGMNILQTAVILFFISVGAKNKATIPIIEHAHGLGDHTVSAVNYINPLPHVLMLTAIVVAVATLGVALALIIKLHQQYNTLEEDEILAQLKDDSS